MKVPANRLFKEFKAFAFKGNMIDLAVALVIGVAFGAVVNSLVKNIFMPLINLIISKITGGASPSSYLDWGWMGINIGAFLGEVLNFLIIAAAVFLLIVKLLGALVKKAVPPADGPVVKECPFCISEIPIKATRCKFCTADVGKK